MVSLVCLILALVLFGLGSWSRWWGVDPVRPYYASFIAAGLFFWVLSELIVRMAGVAVR